MRSGACVSIGQKLCVETTSVRRRRRSNRTPQSNGSEGLGRHSPAAVNCKPLPIAGPLATVADGGNEWI